MWWFLASPPFQPFSIAALVMVGLLAVEVVTTLLGASASALLSNVLGLHGVDLDAAAHHAGGVDHAALHNGVAHPPEGWFGTVYDWLNAGRVPLLVLMVAAIACFAALGMLVQIIAMNVAAPLPPALAAVIAIAGAIPGTRWTSRLLSGVLPQDETYALGDTDLIGRVGIVTLGPVADGAAARAKVQDRYGNWHFPRIAPGAPGLSIPQGASVLIVDKVGGVYTVIAAEGRLAAAGHSQSA
jgi:membrane protein implicated in regulation of membrane protease activity